MKNTPKRFLAIIVCLTMMLALQPAGVPTAFAAAPEWTAMGSPRFSAGEAKHISLAIDSEGTPYVAYRDNGNSNKATVMKYSSGAGWAAVGSPGFSAGVAEYTSLALDSGTPYIAYQDYGNGERATVMKYTGDGGTGWEEVGSPGFSAGDATYTSLAIGSGGTLYVAYRDYVSSSNQKATVMRYIPDTTAPVLTAGGVSRSSDSQATVSFTSDEEGQYYYEVVAEGAAAPSIDTSGAGTACGVGEQTITLTSLSAGSWDIYIKVKDDSGNVSNALSMTIPATPYRHSGSSGGNGGSNKPTVKTDGATFVTETTATLQGKIESGGNAAITEYGFMYGTDKSSLTNKEKAGTGNHRGNFTCGLSGLEAGATYHYKAYAKADDDISYGDILSFTTKKAVQPEMFSDVPDTHWAYASINQLCQKGAVSGYKDGSFRPNAPITRAEFITILVKVLDLQAAATAQSFSDTAGHWAQENIAAASSLGIAGGYTDGSFKPDALITREQMAVMAVKAAGAAVGSGETAFADNDQISSWAKDSVLATVNAGIMKGYMDNTFRPRDHATRAEAVCVILNLIK